MKRQTKFELSILLISLIWGVSFLMSDIALIELGPFTVIFFRFTLGFFIVSAFSFKKLKAISKESLKTSAIVGLGMFSAAILVVFALQTASISTTGFLSALGVVFTPILGFIFHKTLVDKKLIVAICISIIGVALLCLTDDLTIAFGDFLTILSNIIYAATLLYIEHSVKNPKVNQFHLGVLQLGFAGVFALLPAIMLEGLPIPSSFSSLGAILYLAVIATGFAYIMQTYALNNTTAVRVSLIFVSQPVFAGLTAFFFGGEVLSLREYAGALLIIIAILVVLLDFSKIGPTKDKNLITSKS